MQRVKGLFIGLFVTALSLPVLPDLVQAQSDVPLPPIGGGGTRFTCSSINTISSKLGSAQPLIVTGKCVEPASLSIADTRTNITILGKGSGVCGDSRNTIITVVETLSSPPQPLGSASSIIGVRGKNITITGVEIVGLSNNPNVDNRRGIFVQRGGTLQVGRNTANSTNPTIYDEQSGVCIRNVGKNGIEASGGSVVRVVNTEITNVGGDAISASEFADINVGFTSGGEFGLTNDPNGTSAFPGPAHSGPNFLHANTGSGVTSDRNSVARIVGNIITGNGGDGVNVRRTSFADVADNNISGNTGNAIQIRENAGVNLGTTSNAACTGAAGTICGSGTIVNLSNLANTDTGNTGSGIKCSSNGYVAGTSSKDRAGGTTNTLNADGTSFSADCANSTN
jgi:hypothetical protein